MTVVGFMTESSASIWLNRSFVFLMGNGGGVGRNAYLYDIIILSYGDCFEKSIFYGVPCIAFVDAGIRRELDSYQPAGVFAAIGKNGCVYQ